PSLYEGFSLPAVEAMACGVPLVTTTGGALPEVVGNSGEAAITVAPADPGSLAAALREVLSDPERAQRLGEAGRARALRRFTWERVAGETVDQYRTVLATTPC
ncbi:MAG TPA: glycosyltransferase, partial [Acidimicrobiales bacterium]|nr:glycosyltransferase [Acidimicrobiales bacterium]